ncbi:MAG TPA: hypothetical protein VGD91_03785 [Trebonia sp.]
MTEDAQNATALARRHPGWMVWTSRPTAARTRTGAPPRNDGIWAATVEADSYAELDAKLAVQDQADADAGLGDSYRSEASTAANQSYSSDPGA